MNTEFQKEFGKKLSFRAAFEKEFFKRFSPTPQRGTAKDTGSIATVNGTDYYLLPHHAAVPAPSVPFDGVELTVMLTALERQWLERNMRRFGWSALVGYRMKNHNLLTYFKEYDHYVH